MVEQLRQLATAQEMHPARDPAIGGAAPNMGAQVYPPILERVGLDDQVVVPRGAGGEAVDQQVQEFGHGAEGRMRLEAAVVFQLQQCHVVGIAAPAHPRGRDDPVGPERRHQQQPLQVQPEFLRDAERAMRAEVAIAPVQQQHEGVIGGAVEDVLAHIAPMGRGLGLLARGRGQRLLHPGDVHTDQRRVAVRAAALVGHPVGPQVSFLEDVDGQAQRAGGGDGLGVDRARVPVKDDIGDPVPGHQVAEGLRPGLGRIAIGDVAVGIGPERLVAAVEPHPPATRPRQRQHPAQPAEKGSVRPLKEQEPPLARVVDITAHLHGPRHSITGILAWKGGYLMSRMVQPLSPLPRAGHIRGRIPPRRSGACSPD